MLADTAAANANDTAEHPTYIGQDHYVYKWNKTAQAYDKTDIYTKGDAFSIKKVYASVANMEADKSNPDIAEGDFVLVNTGDVEDPDNAKLYVKADGDFEFLVDMSGAIGFTGKTPQFSMGTATTLEAGASAIVTVQTMVRTVTAIQSTKSTSPFPAVIPVLLSVSPANTAPLKH